MRRFILRLLDLFRRDRAEEELAREVASHLALSEDEHRRRGLTPDEARLAARRAMGSVALARDLHRDARSFIWLDDLRRDTRHAARMLVRHRGFAVVAILTLALGIGATTAIFSVVNGVLLRPLPYEGSDNLVRIVENVAGSEGVEPQRLTTITSSELTALRSRTQTLSQVGVYAGRLLTMTLTGRGEPVRLVGERVSAAVLDALAERPMLGRTFAAREEDEGANAVVILAYDTWQRHFGGSPDVLGRIVSLDGRGYAVAGVMGPGFSFPDPQSAFWIPFTWPAGGPPGLTALSLARLRDGVPVETASAEVGTILSQLRPASRAGVRRDASDAPRFEVVRVRDELVAPVRPALLVLAGAVGIVLLIACVNVASLLLARTVTRQKELAVRVAIGAGRGRLIRQALAESVTLALVGGGAGAGLAVGLVALVRTLGASLPRRDLYLGSGVSIPRLDEIGVDGSTLAFAVLVSLVASLLFGVAPAIRHGRSGFADVLRGVSAGHRVRGVLVATELALALTLLVGGGLLTHSFLNLASVDPGYDPADVVWFQTFLPRERSSAQLTAFAETLVERLRAMPGVRSAGYAPQLLTGNVFRETSLRRTPEFPAAPPPPSQRIDARIVSRDFLSVMGVRLIAGRGLDERDRAGQKQVMLINRTLARSGQAGGNPIGNRFYAIGKEPWEIVGIVDDVRQFGLDRDPGNQVFIDFRQLPGPGPNGLYVAVRTQGDSAAVASGLRGIVGQLDPQAAVDDVATMQQLLSNSMSRPRLYAVLLAFFAGVAVILAAIGLYGMTAYSVTQRTREIGVRMALGARRRDVLSLVLGQSLVVTGIGVAAGLAGAAALTGYLERLLFRLTPLDSATFVVAGVFFTGIATVAAYVPARRATRVDPLMALRAD